MSARSRLACAVFAVVFLAAAGGVDAGNSALLTTDRAQYAPGAQVQASITGWCNSNDVPFLAVYDDASTLVLQVTDAVGSGSTVTASFAAPATPGVYTIRTQAQSCPELSVAFAVVTTTTTTSTTTTAPPTTAVPTTVPPGVGAIPTTGGTGTLAVLALVMVVAGAVLVGLRRRPVSG